MPITRKLFSRKVVEPDYCLFTNNTQQFAWFFKFSASPFNIPIITV
jgi:hypothetical protein